MSSNHSRQAKIKKLVILSLSKKLNHTFKSIQAKQELIFPFWAVSVSFLGFARNDRK
jgi:hypothetical protein